MREIKFRAWDESNRIMHNDFKFISSGDEGNDWIIFISDKFTLENHNTNPFENPSPYFSQQLKKMQYAGLKDMCEKEIYEGDIIHSHTDNDDFIIIFMDGSFALENIDKSNYLHITDHTMSNCKVIGNIYENEDLLK